MLRQTTHDTAGWTVAPAPLEATLFGRLTVTLNGERVERQMARPTQLLLAYLLLNPGLPHRREHLAGLLWPESPEAAARKNLRNAVWQLRKVLGEAWVLAEKETITWEAARAVTDVARLMEATGPADVEALQAATAAYQGELLPGFYADWLQPERERLRGVFERRMHQLLERLAEAGRWPEVKAGAERWIALGHVPEPAYRFLMQAGAAGGDRAGTAAAYRRCVQALQTELGVAPSAETEALYRRLTQAPGPSERRSAPPAEAASAGAGPRPHPLPIPPTVFVGREQELNELAALLNTTRLVTVFGPGGAGKTRLALEAAHTLPPAAFPEGAAFAALAGLRDVEQLVPAIAQAAGFSFYSTQDARAQLAEYLRPRRLLLVLDNFEHLVSPASVGLVAELLAAAPQLKVLVTSRVRLNLAGEQLFRVGGMAWPEPAAGAPPAAADSVAASAAYIAVQLFVYSAARAAPEFTLTAENLPAVLEICRLVQGLPLGIVLATAWLAVLTPAEIAREIEQSLSFLEADLGDLPERQRSLGAVFDASWTLLSEEERAALTELAVFQSAFTREAARHVAGVTPRTLLALVHKSWLQPENGGRCRLHELVRQYLLERRPAAAEVWHACQRRHAAYFAGSLHHLSPRLRDQQLSAVSELMAAELNDITAAWHWLVENNEVEAAVYQMLPALYRYCEVHFQGFRLLPLLAAAQAAARRLPDTAASRQALAILLTAQAAFVRSGAPVRIMVLETAAPAHEAALREAWALAGRAEDLLRLSCWGPLLASIYGWLLDADDAMRQLRALLPLLAGPEPERRWELAFVRQSLGRLIYMRLPDEQPAERLAEAAQHLQAALALFQQTGDERETSYTLRLIGIVHLIQQQLPEAAGCLRAAQARMEAAGDWSNAAAVDWLLADIDLRRGRFEAALGHLRGMARRFVERGHLRNAAAALSRESYEALRYSSVAHALEVRRQTLALARTLGDEHGLAWFTWEMGEIQRVAGELDEARRWYDEAQVLFERIPDHSGQIFYHRGRGDLAAAQGDPAEAQRQFQASLDLTRQVPHEWGAA
ncbi:MAG: tetratricopeptide repeat protein, partial [Anaerolineales bacterium]|nr:tetratricopeptide repeat protein [Anaerolineales bacterium]